MFTKLTENQLQTKVRFIESYIDASKNPADGSLVDSNANVCSKNLATLMGELNKDINVQISKKLLMDEISAMYSPELAKKYDSQLEDHLIYCHDASTLLPYCASITLFPLLTEGMKSLGGDSLAPNHLSSFCGSFINLVFAVAAQLAGAVSTPEFLMYFDYFAKKDYGDNYLETHRDVVKNCFQQVVYSLNQPAAARGWQSVFWNIAIFDKEYFHSIFDGFKFPPDYEIEPDWASVERLQEVFMKWFNKERSKALLTFPVITAAMLTKDGKPKDVEFANMCATELANGNSFFVYMSDRADSLSSCCRLRNEISKEENTFSYSLGAGGVSTGSVNVMTININMLAQKAFADKESSLSTYLDDIIDDVHRYQLAYRSIIKRFIDKKMLPIYDAGFISLDKQFLTIGVNGVVEAAEFLGLDPTDNIKYRTFITSILSPIYEKNKRIKELTGVMFNTEFVPAENLGVKNAKWDKAKGLFSPRDCYNSYFYPVEREDISIIEKFKLHGKEYNRYLDGGSALHLNLEQLISKEQYLKLFDIAAKEGCNYWCTNVMCTCCNSCGYIGKETRNACVKCSSKDVDFGTRVIGYLKKIKSFEKTRRKEALKRWYH